MFRPILALALSALLLTETLSVVATPSSVTWQPAVSACVYRVEVGGARTRLGCSRTNQYTPTPGQLRPGDVVEVRRPMPTRTLRGRATVAPDQGPGNPDPD